jgi:methyl-accepting chemotaxis protein
VQVRLAEDNEATGNSESTVRSILDRLAASYAQMSESLNKSAAMGRQLNSDIAQSVVSMQFQDRVNQRIDHIIESLDEIANQLRPHSRSANAEAAAEQTQAVMDRLAKSYTMDAERALAGEPSASQAAEGSIELF